MSKSINWKDQLNQLRPFMTDFRFLVGLGLTLYGLYTAYNEIPAKWTKFQAAQADNVAKEQNKNNLKVQEARLTKLSQDLDKFPTQILPVYAGQVPQLASLSLTQKIVALCDSSQNKYLGLQPKETGSITVDTLVTLPAGLGDGAGASAAPPPSGAGTPGGLSTFKYELSMRGTYVNLVNFVANLTQLPELVLIDGLKITPSSDPEAKADELNLVVNFSIPWIAVQNPPPSPAVQTKTPVDNAAGQSEVPPPPPLENTSPPPASPASSPPPASSPQTAPAKP